MHPVPLLVLPPSQVAFPAPIHVRVTEGPVVAAVRKAFEDEDLLIVATRRETAPEGPDVGIDDLFPVAVAAKVLLVVDLDEGAMVHLLGVTRVALHEVSRQGSLRVATARPFHEAPPTGTFAQVDALVGAGQLLDWPEAQAMLEGLRDNPGALADAVAAMVLHQLPTTEQLALLVTPAAERVAATVALLELVWPPDPHAASRARTRFEVSDGTLSVSRRFDRTPVSLWDAMLDPLAWAWWWLARSRGVSITRVDGPPEAAGPFRQTWSRQGEAFQVEGAAVVVDRPHHLSFTTTIPHLGRDLGTTALRLAADDDGTLLTITVAIDSSDPDAVNAASDEQRERFDQLDEYLDMLGDW